MVSLALQDVSSTSPPQGAEPKPKIPPPPAKDSMRSSKDADFTMLMSTVCLVAYFGSFGVRRWSRRSLLHQQRSQRQRLTSSGVRFTSSCVLTGRSSFAQDSTGTTGGRVKLGQERLEEMRVG